VYCELVSCLSLVFALVYIRRAVFPEFPEFFADLSCLLDDTL
jgi:hypothetical protein